MRHDNREHDSLTADAVRAGASPAHAAPLEEALRCTALVTGCISVALLEARRERNVIGTSGSTPEQLGLRVASGAIRARDPLWIDDASRPNPHVRAGRALAVALLPAGSADDGSPRTLAAIRDRGEWTAAARQQLELFLPLVVSLASGDSGDRDRLTAELQLERDRLSDIIANVPGAVWEEHFDGSYRFVSDQVVTLLGYTAAEYLREVASFLDLVEPEDRERVRATTEEMIARRRGGEHVFRMRRRDGTSFWCESHCRIIFAPDGQPIGIRGVSMDVTARHVAEQRLRASEEHFRDVANATPVMLWTTDINGRIAFQNRRMEEFTRTPAVKLNRAFWIAALHPDDCERVFRTWIDARDRRAWVSFETRLRRHDGEYRDLLVEVAPRFAPDGTFSGFVGSWVDLTDRRQLERRVQEEHQLASIGRLATRVAHEFNNVLMGIQPFADLVRRAPGVTSLTQAADEITSSVQRGRRMTHEILRFANTTDPICAPIEVEPWLEELRPELASAAGSRVQLELEAAPGIFMFADGYQLSQVLTNLAANAKDAMDGHGTLRISASLERSWPGFPPGENAFVHLVVSDSGSGIPQEIRGRIFEPLYTTKPTGTGLGLAVVREVVRRHRGDVVVESPEGSGAVFHLLIPAAKSAAPAGAAASAPPPLRRVLLVEDDESVAAGIAELLHLDGVDVTIVPNGAEVLDALAAWPADAVVLDIGLPDVPGTEVFEQIRERHPDLPVLFSTGHAGELERDATTFPGPTAYLLKPYEVETLLALIQRLRERG